jgi:simple sugar transport system substrate-binding protein
MSEHDILGDAIERLEWDERKVEETPGKKWHQVTRRAALTGGAAGIAALALEACGSSNSASGSSASGIFGTKQSYHFTMVNHVTTNIFFTPTQNGAADACKLLGCSYTWTGSSTSNVGEMVNAINSAITGKADGIATSLISATAFNKPVQKALSSGIPVVAYNADEPQTGRLSYIGQDLFLSGQKLGARIASLVKEGSIAGFIATPGSLNIQPRIDGAKQAIQASGLPIEFTEIATGKAVNDELNAIEAYYLGHKDLKGMVAVDAGSTQGVAQIMQKYGLASKGVHAGGYDLLSGTIQGIQQGSLDFTIDQQPYAQGFYPVVQLFLYKLSGGLASPSDTNTGLVFVTKSNVNPYLAKTRFEGSSSKEQVVNPSSS